MLYAHAESQARLIWCIYMLIIRKYLKEKTYLLTYLLNAISGQTHKLRRHMYTHTKHFAKQVRKGLMHQEDIEINLDMFIQGKN